MEASTLSFFMRVVSPRELRQVRELTRHKTKVARKRPFG